MNNDWVLLPLKYVKIHPLCTNGIPEVCGRLATRSFSAGYPGKSEPRIYCSDCVGFFLSRYYSVIVPNPTSEELAAKEKYDLKAQEMAHSVYPLYL